MAENEPRKGRTSRASQETPALQLRKKPRGESSSSDDSSTPGSGSSSSKSDIDAAAAAAAGGDVRSPREPRDTGGVAEEGVPQRPGAKRRAEIQTRTPQYMDAKLLESMGSISLKSDQTLVTPNYYALDFSDSRGKNIKDLHGARFQSNIRFHRYNVTFEPNVPRSRRGEVVALFNEQNFPNIPIGFDGNAMAFAMESVVLNTELAHQQTSKSIVFAKMNDQVITITLTRTTDEAFAADQGAEFIQALNTCLKRFLIRTHKLKPLFNALYDTRNMQRMVFPDHATRRDVVYHIMRGYEITIKALQSGFLINVDDTSRIIKEGTVFEWMNETRNNSPNSYKQIIADRCRNQILFNTLGSELIRVSVVHFDKHPATFMFKWRRPGQDEREVSIKDYYKERYNKDLIGKQPLIETVPFQRLRPNATPEEIERYERLKNLVPAEVCVFTGLDQAEKSNFHLMKKINEYTKPSALKKKIDLDGVVRKYLLDDAVKTEMGKLQMQMTVAKDVANNTVPAHGLAISLVARVVAPPFIDMGPSVSGGAAQPPKQLSVTSGPNGPVISFEADTRARGPVLMHTEKYLIAAISTQRDQPSILSFYSDIIVKVAQNMGMQEVFSAPKAFLSNGQRSSDFSAAVEDCCKLAKNKNCVPFIFVLVPDELKERYDQIKQVSLAGFGYLSQVIRARTIAKPNMSVGTKVVMQVLAKMGTVKWALSRPAAALGNSMRSMLIVGLDVHHDGERSGSVQAIVGTLDFRASVFYQRSRLVAPGEEISRRSDAYSEYILDMIRERATKNTKTETIVVYRDGVSEGQIEPCINVEYNSLKEALNAWPAKGECPYTDKTVPKIVLIFVLKRHSTRFFQFHAGGSEVDEPAGGGDFGRGGRGGRGGGFDRGGGRGGRGGAPEAPRKKFENPKPGTVVNRGIVRSDRAEFYMASHDTKEGVVMPVRYEILRNETQPPPDMSLADAAARGFNPLSQEDLENLTFYLTSLYPNQCATIKVPVVCQLAQKFAMLSGQHLHSDVVDLQENLRKKMFYL